MKNFFISLTFLLSFFLVTLNANALEYYKGINFSDFTILPSSCSDNMVKLEVTDISHINDQFSQITNLKESTYPISTYLIKVQPNTTYYYIYFGRVIQTYIFYINSDFKEANSTGSVTVYSTSGNPYTQSFTTNSDTIYLGIGFYAPVLSKDDIHINERMSNLMISEKNNLTSFVPYEECSSVPPDIPQDSPITDVSLNNFYTIFLDKLVLFSTFALENKFVLAAITIIILFIVLELLLYLFNKGGYK